MSLFLFGVLFIGGIGRVSWGIIFVVILGYRLRAKFRGVFGVFSS